MVYSNNILIAGVGTLNLMISMDRKTVVSYFRTAVLMISPASNPCHISVNSSQKVIFCNSMYLRYTGAAKYFHAVHVLCICSTVVLQNTALVLDPLFTSVFLKQMPPVRLAGYRRHQRTTSAVTTSAALHKKSGPRGMSHVIFVKSWSRKWMGTSLQ